MWLLWIFVANTCYPVLNTVFWRFSVFYFLVPGSQSMPSLAFIYILYYYILYYLKFTKLYVTHTMLQSSRKRRGRKSFHAVGSRILISFFSHIPSLHLEQFWSIVHCEELYLSSSTQVIIIVLLRWPTINTSHLKFSNERNVDSSYFHIVLLGKFTSRWVSLCFGSQLTLCT